MNQSDRGAWSFLKATFSEFSDDRCVTLASSLAYYTVFSLPPMMFLLLMIVSTSLSAIYEQEEARERATRMLEEQVSRVIGNPAASEEIGKMIEQNQEQGGVWWKTLLSFAGILFGATGVVAALQDALNRVWEVEPAPEAGGVRTFLAKRLLSLGMILGLGFLLLVSFIVSAALKAMTLAATDAVGISAPAGWIINLVVLFAVVTVVFAAIFKYMPDVVIEWRDVWIGAVVTGLLFMLGKWVLEWYLAVANPGERLGSAAASLAVLLVWVYYSAMILLLGAEFTQVWARRQGRGMQPEKGAVRVVRRRESAPATT